MGSHACRNFSQPAISCISICTPSNQLQRRRLAPTWKESTEAHSISAYSAWRSGPERVMVVTTWARCPSYGVMMPICCGATPAGGVAGEWVGDGWCVVGWSPEARGGCVCACVCVRVCVCVWGGWGWGGVGGVRLSRAAGAPAGVLQHPPDLSRKVTTFSTAAASVRLRYEVPEAEISSLPSCT